MSLLSAVQQAKDAAGHAKPFMKLMDALTALDGELRAAGQLQTDADAAAAKKAQLEAEIPSLEGTRNALQQAVDSLKAELVSKKADYDSELAEANKVALTERVAQLKAIQIEHDQAINALKTQIEALQIDKEVLVKERDGVKAQIDDLRKTFDDAHAALHA